MKPKLLISIDPGYDGYKIVINNTLITFSSKMLDTTNESYGVDRRPEGAFYVRREEKKKNRDVECEYLIGDVTELSMRSMDSLGDNSSILDILQSSTKFKEPIFSISLQGALAMALYIKEKRDRESNKKSPFTIDKLKNDHYKVFIGVALPHDYLSNYKSSVADMLICKHDFKLYCADDNITVPIDYDLSECSFMADSQVKCAFIYQFTDDDGYDDPDLMSHLPCLVLDGGYHTFGHFLLDLMFATKACKSNLEYTMSKIDTTVSSQVNNITGRANFTPLQVKEYLRSGDSINYGKERLDNEQLKKMHDDTVVMSATASIHFMEKNVELDDVKCLLMTGGTGAAYYPTYKSYFQEHYGDNLVPVLADKPYRGEKIQPIFAVALGLYKELIVQSNNVDEEE